MTGEELAQLLKADDRSAAWLGRQLEVTRTTAWRWVKGKEQIPEKREAEIRELLNGRTG